MSEKPKVAVCALARDCAKRLSNNITQLEKLAEKFDIEFFVVENNSKDETRIILQEWANRNSKVHLNLFDLTEEELKQNRILRLANCRNMYMDMVRKSEVLFDFLMMVDIDVSYIDIESVIKSIDDVPSDFVGLFSNGRWFFQFLNKKIATNYNDLYALEFSVENKDTNIELLSILKESFKKNRFITCTSAFGGIGIYKYEYIKDLTYSYTMDNYRNKPYCEHKLFNNELLKVGKLYIDKEMEVLYEPISFLTYLKYLLIPLFIRKLFDR